MVGTKVYGLRSLEFFSNGGLLHSDWLPPNCVIAHYHKVDLISTLLDALIVHNAPRRSRRSSPPALIENEWLPATLTLSPRPVWTHSYPSKWQSISKNLVIVKKVLCHFFHPHYVFKPVTNGTLRMYFSYIIYTQVQNEMHKYWQFKF